MVRQTNCPYCERKIHVNATKCIYCGEIVDQSIREHIERKTDPSKKKYIPALAIGLSLLLPGIGHFYMGKPMVGAILFLLASLGYVLFVFLGIAIHVTSVILALKSDPYK